MPSSPHSPQASRSCKVWQYRGSESQFYNRYPRRLVYTIQFRALRPFKITSVNLSACCISQGLFQLLPRIQEHPKAHSKIRGSTKTMKFNSFETHIFLQVKTYSYVLCDIFFSFNQTLNLETFTILVGPHCNR